MPTLEARKAKLEAAVQDLEQTLLAIDSLNNVMQKTCLDTSPLVAPADCAYLLNSLIGPALDKVEHVREMLAKPSAATLQAAA